MEDVVTFFTSKQRRNIKQLFSRHISFVKMLEISPLFSEKLLPLLMSHDSQSQQVSKKKKKRRSESLLGAPFHLKDGDTIGIKVFVKTWLRKKNNKVEPLSSSNPAPPPTPRIF